MRIFVEETSMKQEPDIVRILREEERSHKFCSYYIQHAAEKNPHSTNVKAGDVSTQKISGRKITHRVMLSKKILFITLKLLISNHVFEGENIKKFENTFRNYLDVKHTTLTSSGRMALYLILNSLSLEEGSEILMPSYMLPALPQVSLYCRLKPVFVDIDPCTFNIDPADIEKKITPKSKVILAVHLFGRPCPIKKIEQLARKYNLILIEDCAQAVGATFDGKKVGTFGKASYFSFGCAKDINTFGGGMIATNDDALHESIQNKLRDFEWPKKSMLVKRFLHNIVAWVSGISFIFDYVTYPLLRVAYVFDKEFVFNRTKSKDILKLKNINERLFFKKYRFLYTNLQATVALEQFKNVERHLSIKNNNAAFLNEQLQTDAMLDTSHRCTFYRYGIKTEHPKTILKELFKAGILTTDGSYAVLSDLEMFKEYQAECPKAREISKQLIYLPVQPHLNREDMVKMVHILRNHLSSTKHKKDTFLLKENVKHQLSHSLRE